MSGMYEKKITIIYDKQEEVSRGFLLTLFAGIRHPRSVRLMPCTISGKGEEAMEKNRRINYLQE